MLLGTPPPDATQPTEYLPINIPTIVGSTSMTNYTNAYPQGFFAPYESNCFSPSETSPNVFESFPTHTQTIFTGFIGFLLGSLSTLLLVINNSKKHQYLPIN